MASAAVGAGLVFLCNPNNPTGTAHPAGAVEAFVRQVKAQSPDTAILLDEAYMDHAVDPGVESAVALRALSEAWNLGSMNTLSAAAGIASLNSPWQKSGGSRARVLRIPYKEGRRMRCRNIGEEP